MYQRAELNIVKKRLQEDRKHIQVIMGPRQVGKTTLAKQLIKEIDMPVVYESADGMQAASPLWLEQLWQTSRLKLKIDNENPRLLIIDEIQKIHNWSETVKKLWDEDTFEQLNLKILLLGSSRLLIQKGLSESLAGRFESIYLGHWSYPEMEKAFTWSEEEYTWFGAYPGSATLIHDENRWKQYIKDALIETSISKDIFQLAQINKPALLKNLFELGCAYSGQVLSYTKMLGQLQDAGNTTTLSHYLYLLNAAGLLAGLEKISFMAHRKRTSSPKNQVHNTALLSAQTAESSQEIRAVPEKWGRWIESVVGSHLLNQSIKQSFNLYYYRENNKEVDFVLEKNGQVVAIEVKSTLAKNSKGLEAFKKKYPDAKIYMIDDRNLAWKEFIRINPAELF